MSEPPERNPPIVRTETAAKDVGAAIDFILKRRGIPKLNLIGWSWGCAIMASYTSENNEKVNALILHAPQWMRAGGSGSVGNPGAYRTQTREQAKDRWLAQIPRGRQAEILPAIWFKAWADATWGTDPIGGMQSPPVIRAPNGVLQDAREFWEAGRPLYDAGKIRVPTFLIVGKWDTVTPPAMMHGCFAALANAPARLCVEIDEGTHHVMMEKNRLQLFEAVQHFLDER
jgi:pimeloyl-ACP methyl ester carboxylesterase